MARERTGGDPLAERIVQLNTEISRLREENRKLEADKKELKDKKKVKVSTVGSLDKIGVKHATGGGLACAPVGAYSQEIVDLIYTSIDSTAPLYIRNMYHLSFVEDIIGGVVGFMVGWACITLYKILRPS
jgi:hypothetical protein